MCSLNYKILAIMAVSWLMSCTESPIVLPDIEVPQTDRVVLIEDFTGVQCPNCPKGAATIENIMATYEGKVTAIGIHGSFLTKPIPNESLYDFRTQFAKDLEQLFASTSSKPSAMIDRTLFKDEPHLPSENTELWQSYVEQELNKPLLLNMDVEKSYDAAERRITLSAEMVSTTDLSGNFIISIFLTESHIIDAQEDGSEIIRDYEHNHVLRHMMTKFDGDVLTNNFIKAVPFATTIYSYTIPEEFKPENMEAVVVVSRNEINDKSVVQANYLKIVE